MSYEEAVEAAVESFEKSGYTHNDRVFPGDVRLALQAALPHLRSAQVPEFDLSTREGRAEFTAWDQPAPTVAPSVETVAHALAWDEWDSLTVGEQSDCRDQAQAVVRADPRRTGAEVKAEALEEAVAAIRAAWEGHWNLRDPRDPEVSYSVDRWLEVRAARIREGQDR